MAAAHAALGALLLCMVVFSLAGEDMAEAPGPDEDCWMDLYLEYLKEWDKPVPPASELDARLESFKDTYRSVQLHSERPSGPMSYNLSLNMFADWLDHELDDLFAPPPNSSSASSPQPFPPASEGSIWPGLDAGVMFRPRGDAPAPPPSLSWASHDNPTGAPAVSPVRNQGMCGACWAFAAAGSVEGSVAIRTGRMVAVSAQELLDCDTRFNKGCAGGSPFYAFQYIAEKGITSWDKYPYVPQQGTCRRDGMPGVSAIHEFGVVPPYNQKMLMAAVAEAPVTAGVCGTQQSFLFYQAGVLDDPQCCTQQNHALLIVGWGDDEALGPYWLAKNSWSAQWGEQGYIRLRRLTGAMASARSPGQCGLAVSPSLALEGFGGNATNDLEPPPPNPLLAWVSGNWRNLLLALTGLVLVYWLVSLLHTLCAPSWRAASAGWGGAQAPPPPAGTGGGGRYGSVAMVPVQAQAPPRVQPFQGRGRRLRDPAEGDGLLSHA